MTTKQIITLINKKIFVMQKTVDEYCEKCKDDYEKEAMRLFTKASIETLQQVLKEINTQQETESK